MEMYVNDANISNSEEAICQDVWANNTRGFLGILFSGAKQCKRMSV